MIYCTTAVNMGQFPSLLHPELHMILQPGPLQKFLILKLSVINGYKDNKGEKGQELDLEMKVALGTSTRPFPLAQEQSFEANLPTVLTDHTHPFCQAPLGFATCSQIRLSPALKLTQKTYNGGTVLPAGRQPWGLLQWGQINPQTLFPLCPCCCADSSQGHSLEILQKRVLRAREGSQPRGDTQIPRKGYKVSTNDFRNHPISVLSTEVWSTATASHKIRGAGKPKPVLTQGLVYLWKRWYDTEAWKLDLDLQALFQNRKLQSGEKKSNPQAQAVELCCISALCPTKDREREGWAYTAITNPHSR